MNIKWPQVITNQELMIKAKQTMWSDTIIVGGMSQCIALWTVVPFVVQYPGTKSLQIIPSAKSVADPDYHIDT